MKKMHLWLLISLIPIMTQAQSQELVYWTGENTFTYSYPQAGVGLSSEISSATQNYSGLNTYNDSRNIWTNPNSSATVNPLTAPYLSYVLNLNEIMNFDRFVIHGAAPTTTGIKMQLRWDVDGFASSLGDFTPGSSSYNLTSVDLSGTNHIFSSNVEFRIYFYAVSGNVYHSGTGPYPTTDGTPSSYTSYGRCFSVWGEQSCNSVSTITTTECNSYTSPSGNYTWSSTGLYKDTIPNNSGCDSIITVDLTINYSNTGTDVQTACDSLVWIDGNTYYASNNTATHTLTNIALCDSLVTLDLTVNYSNTGIDVQTACFSYLWLDGNTYTSNNNTATHTINNVAGCDSLVTLDLTINTVDVSVTLNGITLTATLSGASYQWIDCNNSYLPIAGETAQSYTPTVNGDYAVIIDDSICMDTSVCYNINGVGIDENPLGGVVIYPNPTSSKFYVEGVNIETIELRDINGRLIQLKHPASGKTSINLKGQTKGIYLIKIIGEGNVVVKKIVFTPLSN